MRELHVVAVSEDGRHVVLEGAGEEEQFLIALDDRLRSAIREERPTAAPPAPPAPPAPAVKPAARSTVTPKQIQARLRAGETVEQIAASAGMPVAKVERFAWPVVSEQERMITGTRAAVLVRSRRGPSVLPIGDAVAEHLQDLGLPADAMTWTARREESGRWLVQVSFLAKSRTRTAGWRFEPSTREVSPVDPYSAALGYADAPVSHREAGTAPAATPGRKVAAPQRRPAAAPAAKAARARGAAAPLRAPSGSKVRAARPAAARPAPARGPSVPPPPVQTSAVAKPRQPAAAAPRTPSSTASARPQAPSAPTAGAVSKATRAPAQAVEGSSTGPPTLRVVRPPSAAEPAPDDTAPDDTEPATTEPATTEPATPKPPPQAPARRAAGGRASVPAWADVLLGTAPVHRPADPDSTGRD